MAELIFQEQTLTGFEYSSDYGCHIIAVGPEMFTLELGESYTVIFDGVSNIYQARDASSMIMDGAVLIGDISTIEPCVVAYTAYGILIGTADTKDSHTLTIYHGEASAPSEPANPNGVSLYDHGGNTDTYDIGKGIRLFKADGTVQDFFPGNAEELTVNPDFSEGDIIIEPSDSTVYEKVSILKPANLIPENIAEGVEVAGVVGNLVSGGDYLPNEGLLKYIAYQLHEDTREIIIYGILWQELYDAGIHTNITIPSVISGYQVILSAKGVN